MGRADQLVQRIADELPARSLRRALRVLFLPSVSDVRARCPKCDRALPVGAIGPQTLLPVGGGAVHIPWTDEELEAACLVDGKRSSRAEAIRLAELFVVTDAMVRVLAQRRWKREARQLARGLEKPDERKRAEAVGQALERLRLSGPFALRRGPEIDTLIASLGRYWTSSPERA